MQVIIWEDKHGTSLYDASTEENKQASARQILNDFVANRYIDEPEDPMKYIEYSSIDLELASLTDEQIEALPLKSMRDDARKNRRALKRRLLQYADDVEDYQEVLKVIAGEKIYSAPYTYQGETRKGEVRPPREITPWQMLQNYAGGEYMTISLESVWTP